MTRLTESHVESTALDWLQALGWGIRHGDEIAPDAEHLDFSAVVLQGRAARCPAAQSDFRRTAD
ncbi:MAG: hypothetical protein H5T43_05025 [Methanomethylovorans sp.]|jgi:type I restriction enzyme R subunit|nr:hypothetical protein [Methanomethylovorans sp.]